MPVVARGGDVWEVEPPFPIIFLAQLVRKRAQGVSDVLRRATERAYSARWWFLLAVALQRAIAESVLRESGADLMPAEGSVELPLVDVLDACRA